MKPIYFFVAGCFFMLVQEYSNAQVQPTLNEVINFETATYMEGWIGYMSPYSNSNPNYAEPSAFPREWEKIYEFFRGQTTNTNDWCMINAVIPHPPIFNMLPLSTTHLQTSKEGIYNYLITPYLYGEIPPTNYGNKNFSLIDSSNAVDSYVAYSIENENNPLLDSLTLPLKSPNGSAHIVKIGNDYSNSFSEKMELSFKVTEENKLLKMHYAVVLEAPGHDSQGSNQSWITSCKHNLVTMDPYFYAAIKTSTGNIIPCTELFFTGHKGKYQGMVELTNIVFKPWSQHVMDLSGFIGQTVTLNLVVSDCEPSAHKGYAYVDFDFLINEAITFTGKACPNEAITFNSGISPFYVGQTYHWDFGDGTVSSDEKPTKSFLIAGNYNVKVDITYPTSDNQVCATQTEKITININVENCEIPCPDCISTFSPLPGEKYALFAWVKEAYTSENMPITFSFSGIKIGFNKQQSGAMMCRPLGNIVDGWQRIECSFTIPLQANSIQIELVNEQTNAAVEVYFDDIRIHPYFSNMKSFVYDPFTHKLTAELDENNYATKYEYDDEGILIRVKKETERGVMTIKENRTKQSEFSSK